MKWWQKKVKGWTVPFWYSDTPLYSKRAVDYGLDKLAEQVRKDRSACLCEENAKGKGISGWCSKHHTDWM